MSSHDWCLIDQGDGVLTSPGKDIRRAQDCAREASPPTVLIIDEADLNRQLLRAMLKSEPLRLLEARRPAEALSILATQEVDLVILDLMMPGISGPDFCRLLKADRRTQLIPVLMLTSVQGADNEIAGLASGADEFLIKPLHPSVVRARIRAMLRHKAVIDSLEEAEVILFALARSVEQRDGYTAGHCERLAGYSLRLGMALGLPRETLLALYRGGYLHDIGKIAVPDAILHKHGRLTEDEWRIMRTHTIRGEEICRPMKSLARVLPIIRSHHERWDGGGYPDGLRGQEIPICARILQVADIYDALTTTRPYKPALPPEHAFAILDEEVRRGWRDPELVAVFRQLHTAGNGNGNGNGHHGADLSSFTQLEAMRRAIAHPPQPAA